MLTARQAIELLKSQVRSRPLVPFLGAGISVSTGFPSIRQVNEYLAKVDFSIQRGVYRHRYPRLSGCEKRYREHPSRFLLDFGWPDVGQLDADIWNWLSDHTLDRRVNGYAVLEQLSGVASCPEWLLASSSPKDCIAHDISPYSLDGSSLHSTNQLRLDRRTHLDAIVQHHLRQDLERMESGAEDAAYIQWISWKRWYFGKPSATSESSNDNRAPELLYGNWESLLDHLCEGNMDLADQLFTQLELRRAPSLAHRYLAFLCDKLSIPLVLTTNFDSLLEQAFRDQSIPFKVFDVHRDAAFPSHALVKRQTSLIKMHGSAYGLRLGERLKYPLDATVREQVLAFVPESALLMVLGFSGSERRMIHLLHALGTYRQAVGAEPSILWLWKGQPTATAIELAAEQGSRVQFATIENADTFLQEFYYTYSDGHPVGRVPYPAIQDGCKFAAAHDSSAKSRASPPPRSLPKEWVSPFRVRSIRRQPVHVFLPDGLDEHGTPGTAWATLCAASFINSLDHAYKVVWIDLENHHTVAGIAAELFAKIRVFDPFAPLAPLTDSDDAIPKIVERVGEALQRGRYVIVLDSLDCFGRSQTMHHGSPTFELFDEGFISTLSDDHPARQLFGGLRTRVERQFASRVDGLKRFLTELLNIHGKLRRDNVNEYFLDSYVCVTAGGRPRARVDDADVLQENPSHPFTLRCLTEVVEALRGNSVSCSHVVLHTQGANDYGGLSPCGVEYPRGDGVTADFPPGHWRRRRARNVMGQSNPVGEINDRVRRQASDAFSLLGHLCSPAAPSKDMSAAARDGFLALMVVVRRPRSVPLIRSLVERWVVRLVGDRRLDAHAGVKESQGATPKNKDVHSRVDEIIASLVGIVPEGGAAMPNDCAKPVVGRWEHGGNLWLFREVHESVYEALTECLSIRQWIIAWQSGASHPSGVSPAAAIVSGLLVITWHWAAARSFYADIYRPTQDVNAFNEYLYHRTSALRVMTLLIAIIIKSGDRSDSVLAEIRNLLPRANREEPDSPTMSFSDFIGILGVFEPLGAKAAKLQHTADFERIEDLAWYLHLLRDHGLETLEKALVRNQDRLKRISTPQTLEAMAWQYLNRELYDLSGESFSLSFRDVEDAKRFVAKVNAPVEDPVDQDFSPPGGRPRSGMTSAFREFFEKLQHASIASQLDFRRAAESTMSSDRTFTPNDGHGLHDALKRSLRDEHEKAKLYAGNSRSLLATIRGAMNLGMEDKLVSEALDAGIQQAIGNRRQSDLQTLHELRTKHQFTAALIWEPLVLRWHDSKARRHSEAANSQFDQSMLKAEDFSREYENVLRATAESSNQDARHRSSALVLRARSLYLRERFRQGHRWLDLAAAGLNGTFPEQQVSSGIVHLHRAELLAISAGTHYRNAAFQRTPSQRLRSIMPELQKLERAERELADASASLREASHLARLRVRVDIGIAVVRIESLLFHLERDYWSHLLVPGVLNDREYAGRSAALERGVLEAMRALRSVLDSLPFVKVLWHEVVNDGRSLEPLVRRELQIYGLFRQLFVVAIAYSSLLRRMTDRDTTPKQILEGMNEESPGAVEDRTRWRNWARAARFEQLSTVDENDSEIIRSATEHGSDDLGLRARLIVVVQKASSPESCQAAWDLRRKKRRRTSSLRRRPN